jgi:hypothetical protein
VSGAERRSAAAHLLAAQLQRFRDLWDGDVEGATRALAADDAAAAAFAGFAVRQQVAVQLLARLGDVAGALPAGLRQRLERRAALQRERTERLVELAGRLPRSLERSGLPVLVLKGPPLARRYYGALDARESADLDLLIRPRDGSRAHTALAELGFARRSRTPLGVAVTLRFVHALDYVGEAGVVDLHWALDRHPSLRLDSEAPWRAARREPLGGADVAVPSDDVELLALALGVVRDAERGRLKLKHLLDLRVGIERPGAGVVALAAARAQRAERPLRRALELAAVALADARPTAAGDAVLRREGDANATRTALPALVAGGPSRRSRSWAFRSWEMAPAASAAWWLVSLPFRLAVHGRRRAAGSGEPVG